MLSVTSSSLLFNLRLGYIISFNNSTPYSPLRKNTVLAKTIVELEMSSHEYVMPIHTAYVIKNTSCATVWWAGYVLVQVMMT